MKVVLALAAVLAAAPLAATSPPSTRLPGISDDETTIPYGQVQQTERGHGDVLFVRDRVNRWYRLQLNQGCLRGQVQLDLIVYRNGGGSSSQIDRFTQVVIPRDMRTCNVSSIRRSAPPPQVDKHSIVTLD